MVGVTGQIGPGRPSTYRSEYCDEVIAFCADGLSLSAFAGSIGVGRSTINGWMNTYPEFEEAVGVAKAKRTLALERQMLSLENGPAVTARIFALKNADPEEWRDKQHHEHAGDKNNPIVVAGADELIRKVAEEMRALKRGAAE